MRSGTCGAPPRLWRQGEIAEARAHLSLLLFLPISLQHLFFSLSFNLSFLFLSLCIWIRGENAKQPVRPVSFNLRAAAVLPFEKEEAWRSSRETTHFSTRVFLLLPRTGAALHDDVRRGIFFRWKPNGAPTRMDRHWSWERDSRGENGNGLLSAGTSESWPWSTANNRGIQFYFSWCWCF